MNRYFKLALALAGLAAAAWSAPAAANTVTVWAHASLSQNVGAHMFVRLNAQTLAPSATMVTSTTSQAYTFETDASDYGGSLLDIVFDNADGSRSLSIDKVIVNGVAVLPTAGWIDRGLGSAATDGQDVLPGASTLTWNAAWRLWTPPPVNSTPTSSLPVTRVVKVRASSTLSQGVGALMHVNLNGKTLSPTVVLVKNTSPQDFTFTSDTADNGGSLLDVVFTNDASDATGDRNLIITSVTVNGVTVQPSAGWIDRGIGSAAFDGLDLVAGGSFLAWNGAWRVWTPPPGQSTTTSQATTTTSTTAASSTATSGTAATTTTTTTNTTAASTSSTTTASSTATTSSSSGNPVSMTKGLHVDPSSPPLRWLLANPTDWRANDIKNYIAYQPTAGWFDPWGLPWVVDFLANAKATNKLPVLVSYYLSYLGCGSLSDSQMSAYRTWVQQYAKYIGSQPALLVLEPDQLAMIPCMSSSAQSQRYQLFNYAADQFNTYAPNTWVYMDSGNSNWIPAQTMAGILVAAGISKVHGFSLNVSNFRWDSELKPYGMKINDYLQASIGTRKAFVHDTSRNGNGPTADAQWCDPAGRKIGASPRVLAINGEPEMYLWIKEPGGVDGCAHASGFWPDIAYNLIWGL